MDDPATTIRVGPLGSTIHVLRADADTVAEPAAIDWNRHFRRVCLDPVRGLITLMAPSHLHEDLTKTIDHIVEVAADGFGRTSKGILSTRLRRQGEPPGTGMEPDGAFYVGNRAVAFRAAFAEGEAAAEAFLEQTGPDLVVKVEITNVDEGKIARYGQMGVRELWRFRGRRGSRELQADSLALRPEGPPRLLAASEVLEGLTPADVCDRWSRSNWAGPSPNEPRRWPESSAGAGRAPYGSARKRRRRIPPPSTLREAHCPIRRDGARRTLPSTSSVLVPGRLTSGPC